MGESGTETVRKQATKRRTRRKPYEGGPWAIGGVQPYVPLAQRSAMRRRHRAPSKGADNAVAHCTTPSARAASSKAAPNNVSVESAETLLGGDQQTSPHNTDAALAEAAGASEREKIATDTVSLAIPGSPVVQNSAPRGATG